MSTRDRILAAARQLAQTQPPQDISLTAVAQAAGVSWPTVRRYLGNKQQLQAFLAQESPQVDQPLDTRSRILASAQRVFAQQGYAGATLDAIAADAGLTKGAVYWHFASKIDLFIALLRQHRESPLHVTPEQVQQLFAQLGPAAAIKTLVTQQLEYAQAHPDWCRLAMEFYIQSRQADVQQVFQDMDYQGELTGLITILRQLQDQGWLNASVDAQMLETYWSALVNGLILNYIIDPETVDLTAEAEAITQLLWQGLKPIE
ncbi:TetR family transcriptional regulator [Leptolyngbya sp. KIOST-1]|uniref:TetR family transcriptional regulator n=1 Tax=Leptolyngbya sp. KIOST-1 TaxID=1229172 RepID=UPI000559ED59|nr:TetR family transcriptional regulator [Leptolyngbya sp. KIOST-1]